MSDETGRKGIAACGTSATTQKLTDALVAFGLPGRSYPLVELAPREDWAEGVSLEGVEWAVLSSPGAARFCMDILDGFKGKIACVGESTGDVVRERGGKVTLMPLEQDRAGLLGELKKLPMHSGKIFVPLSSAAPSELPDGLADLGFDVIAPIVYDNLPDEPVMRAFADDVDNARLSAAAFTSASAVDYGNYALGLPDVRIYCIGRSTAERAEAKGLKVFGIAYESSVEGLAEIIKQNEKSDD